MNIPQAATVGNVIMRGNESAANMSQQSPSAFDVWTHSYDGMADRMRTAASDPVAFLAGDPAQQARVDAAMTPGNWSRSSVDQMASSIAAQGSALGEKVDEIGNAQGALQTVGATFALLTGVEQMISSALSIIPFPAFPTVRITDMDVGLPHAHAHPPNLVPPAPPVPLPSTGPVIPIPILSGATQTLINGMPAGRCGDMGLEIWCGSYFPMYEVFLGSSSVWIEGMRAARVMMDITKHCMFTIPKPSDPPIGPMVGMTVSSSSNVLIGGVPMPSLAAIGIGLAAKGLAGLLGKGARAFARATAPLRKRLGSHLDDGFIKCKILRAEPVNFITGEVTVDQQDYSIPGLIPLEWERHYGSHSSRRGVCGYGWNTPADARLVFEDDGVVLFYDGSGGSKVFPHLPQDGPVQEFVDGAKLDVADGKLSVLLKSGLAYFFPFSELPQPEILVDYIEDRCGNYVCYLRDEHGLREIIERAGRRIEVKSEKGLVREMRLKHPDYEDTHPLVRYEYSEKGELLEVYDALEHPYRFRYENRRLTQHTDRNGLSFYYEYDSKVQSARCYHAWGDGGLYDYRFDFDPVLRRIAVTNSLGALSTIQLNELNFPIWEIDPLGGITRYEYDDRGRTTAVIEPAGHRTTYEYDERGNLLKLTRADCTSIISEFDASNRPITVMDPNGGSWQQCWDARGLLLEHISPLGNVSRYEYDDRGQLTAFVNPRGARTELGFDGIGNLALLRDALDHRTFYAYDPLGNVIAKADPLGRKTFYAYDLKSRLLSTKLPSGSSIDCAYDAEDKLIRYIDENGAETRLEYCGLGEISRCIQPDGHTVEYLYDTEERLVGLRNQRCELYQLKRDALGRIVEETDYWGQARRYSYDVGGHLMSATDPLGQHIDYVTDPLGRIKKKLLEQQVAEEFWYDANGNLTRMKNAYTEVNHIFDAEDRLLQVTAGQGYSIENIYDAASNRIARKTSLGNYVEYDFNMLNQVSSIRINMGKPIEIRRDVMGQITHEALTSGLSRNLNYNSDGLLTEQSVTVGEMPLFATHYEYDRRGNLTKHNDSRYGNDTYRYDPLGRILEHINPQGQLTHYLNDPAGDRLVTRKVDETDTAESSDNRGLRAGEYGGTHYRFDHAGNVVERCKGERDLQLVWDANHRLVESRGNGSITYYGYDPQGRRLFKQTEDALTHFFWDGDALLGETTMHTKLPEEARCTREYIYYPGTFEPLAMLVSDANGREIFYYHNDPNGCPTRLIDCAGRVQWAASYTAWGDCSIPHITTIENPLRLQGQYYDDETGLHYNRHRYYDPHIGQFLSKDPLGLIAGNNPYSFAPNALQWVDPLGLTCLTDEQALSQALRVRGARVDPSDIRGARPGPTGVAGHGHSKHGFTNEMLADVINNADRRFVGVSKHGRPVNVFVRGGDVVITEADDVTRVITGYGSSGINKLPGGRVVPGKAVDAADWADNPSFNEVVG